MYYFPEGFRIERFLQELDSKSAHIQLFSVKKTFKNREEYVVPNYVFFITLKGEKIFYDAQNAYPVASGDLLLIRKGAKISCDLTELENQSYEALMFYIDPELITNILNKYKIDISGKILTTSIDLCSLKVTPILKNCIESLLPFFMQKPKHYEVLIQLKMEELILHLLDSPLEKEILTLFQEAAQPERLPYISLIENCLKTPQTIEQMAKFMNQSPSKFKTTFKALFGLPPAQYLQNKRLEKANHLLLTSKKTITEIGFETGFETTSHFIKVFKKKYDITPGQLKKSKLNI